MFIVRPSGRPAKFQRANERLSRGTLPKEKRGRRRAFSPVGFLGEGGLRVGLQKSRLYGAPASDSARRQRGIDDNHKTYFPGGYARRGRDDDGFPSSERGVAVESKCR